MKQLKKIIKAALFIKKRFSENTFDAAVIFGSGLNPDFNIDNNNSLNYSLIPYFPEGKVAGHKNRLIYQKINGKKALFFEGRPHFFEGFNAEEVTFYIRVIKELGIRYLIITNASGGLNKDLKIGDIVIIKDHINFTFNNPLIGANIEEHGTRFVDMTDAYDKELIALVKKYKNYKFMEGIYIGVSGPNYETTAEVNFFKTIGADMVGMSTVMEVITARHCGIRVLGLSCITNSYCSLKKVDHNNVINTANEAKVQLFKIINYVIGNL
ncbi:MAG: purine-nucleoside phosphorylase [Spirochaetes bacterium]|nr:purine-nucleoside phosphorylase [Spirochaetota bacterium]